jgi:phosphate transport system regulatory protein PhoU
MTRRQRLRELEQLRQDIARMGHLVVRQLESALAAVDDFDPGLADTVIEKDDLIDNLNLRVEARSFSLAGANGLSDGEYRAARSAVKVASNLEHAGDSATHICKQLNIMAGEGSDSVGYDLGPLAQLAPRSLQQVLRAYLREDPALARRACESEPELDHLYVEALESVRLLIESDPGSTRHFLHVLAILKYLEKVGDYVLNIGEQAIYLHSGRRLKFGQFQQLDKLLGEHAEDSGFKPYLDGISGAIVARVGNGVPLLYKEGSQKKIEEEVEKSVAWRRIDRDLTPKVLSTVSFQDRQALLREYVDGTLLSQLYFEDGDAELQSTATALLCETLRQLWMRTLVSDPPRLTYVSQIEERLPEIYAFHQTLKRLAATRLRFRGGVCLPLRQQLEKARALEADLAPPFSVWLHGDFNPNNVVFDRRDKGLKFIDIHRSRYGDYLQDVTVFLVGLVRNPELAPSTRSLLKRVESQVMETVRDFAREMHDESLENRLLLGLGRSYITSARVILQPKHAEWLFRQGRICLQKVIDRG